MESYDIYELMIIPPNKKTEMIFEQIEKEYKANLSLVRDLIVLGAELDWQDKYGLTALHVCARDNHPEIAKMLIEAGADVDIQDEDGWTALHLCAYYTHPEIARMLVEAGADKTIPNNSGKLPYELAKTQELQELLKV